ncbi:uncharacterized protein K441DRAFT_564164, partial [Cenococcum geophilum 1.58]|uniref:uncharacterized protein n=1 Tax=Cenococcum geophilum 1.58 TaxID=794803 RepID=UPI0035901B4E
VLLNNYLKDKPRIGRTKKITPDIKQRVVNAVIYDRYGRKKSSKKNLTRNRYLCGVRLNYT